MHDGMGSVYFDGKSLLNLTLPRSSDEELDAVSHFYFGAYDEQLHSGKIHATVANVLLYNRPLDDAEIGALNANKVTIPPPEKKPVPASAATSPSVGPANERMTTETRATAPAPTPAAPKPTEQATLNGSSGASGDAASTPAEPKSEENKPAESESEEPKSEGLNAATSSAEEGTADQPASATSSSAAITDVGASSSDDAQTVGTEGGDMMQADQPTQASAGISDAANAAAHNAEGNGQEGLHPQVKEAEAATLSSSLLNSSQWDNSVAGTMRGSGLLPLLLLLGLWGFAAA
ncbi:trans-sialidase [Trypanosoma cruzi Dm28c]|uniref:Trans-sialidase n=1 Tax=Trypanosoma cruzi Dm28c TaxID=1416333 RepID=V5BD41_TRYCR|nr:trans-sialidase [Trypanosoma cruzi Dm28c]